MLRGTVDATGERVDTSYGFTAHSVTPAILFGSVRGEVQVEGERQIARSDRQFALILSDERYRAVMAVVERWRDRPQPSYNLNRANCVHFVAELAAPPGLRVENAAAADEAPALLPPACAQPQPPARACALARDSPWRCTAFCYVRSAERKEGCARAWVSACRCDRRGAARRCARAGVAAAAPRLGRRRPRRSRSRPTREEVAPPPPERTERAAPPG